MSYNISAVNQQILLYYLDQNKHSFSKVLTVDFFSFIHFLAVPFDVQIKVIELSITTFTTVTTVQLTVSWFVDGLGAIVVNSVLYSFALRVVCTQVLTLFQCYASKSFKIVTSNTARGFVDPCAFW